MNAIFFSIFAAVSAALANLFFRKNSEAASASSSPTGYLVFFYLTSFILSFILYPTILSEELNYTMLSIGMGVGVLNILLMLLTSKALQKGPAGLTFAFQNTSAVFPGMILFLLFGTEYGFSYSFPKLLGILLVVYGLFLGAKNESTGSSKQWLKYAVACFGVQVLALTLIQARCLLFDCPVQEIVSTNSEIASKDDVCFMLGQFGVAFLVQLSFYLLQKSPKSGKTALYGSLGGLANFCSTGLLLLATKWALPFEKGILFPSFAVATIIACNLWANKLYGEKFNYASNATCACGILIGLAA